LQITDITIAMHERSSPRLAVFGTRDGKLPMGVLRIETDAGIEGTNFLSYPGPGPEAIAREIVTFVKPLLLGADPLEIGAALHHARYNRYPSTTLRCAGMV
jgi:L-alanine-DL-glutamate epimerase-like enolase superfamily enzyme